MRSCGPPWRRPTCRHRSARPAGRPTSDGCSVGGVRGAPAGIFAPENRPVARSVRQTSAVGSRASEKEGTGDPAFVSVAGARVRRPWERGLTRFDRRGSSRWRPADGWADRIGRGCRHTGARGRTQRGARKPTPVRLSCPGSRADEHSAQRVGIRGRTDGWGRDRLDRATEPGSGRAGTCCHLDNLGHRKDTSRSSSSSTIHGPSRRL